MAELVDALDLKSSDHCGRAGSTPAPGTFNNHLLMVFFRAYIVLKINKARIAQLVEHDLAKVGVAGPSPVSRSFFMFLF